MPPHSYNKGKSETEDHAGVFAIAFFLRYFDGNQDLPAGVLSAL